jgi:tetratricopeptide (TPR) repeat protein
MSDSTETERPPLPGTSDPSAWAALSAASREKADAFLEEQIRVAQAQERQLHLQAEDLKREDRLRHWSLIVRHTSDVVKMTFEIAAALITVALVVGIGAFLWDASNDHGVVVEAFEVPPDFAARGDSGQVLANQLLDKLNAMQNATESARPARSYANNWGNDIKVQISDTGISLGEISRYLHAWLGHETHIGGEVFQSGPGKITLTARVTGGGSTSFTGTDGDVDSLVQKAAEQIYRQTQPYRYAVYRIHNLTGEVPETDWHEARQIFTKLTSDPSPVERIWAWIGLANVVRYHDGDARAGERDLQNALALQPDLFLALKNYTDTEAFLGHPEASVAAGLKMRRIYATLPDRTNYIANLEISADVSVDPELGDFQLAAMDAQRGVALAFNKDWIEGFRESIVDAIAGEHDGKDAKSRLASLPPLPALNTVTRNNRVLSTFEMNVLLENWPAVAVSEPAAEKAQWAEAPGWDNVEINLTSNRPWLALAKAELGDFKSADAVIATTPLDCYDCVRVRGTIAALAGRAGAADHWFEDAVHQGPSIPLAYADWGKTLLWRHDTDAAIAKFTLANQKGPRFADPLEMWGEALMQKNRSDLALAKFEEADKFAPNWGRLHLKWGEALMYTGNKAEAQKQFALASRLGLTSAERESLDRFTTKARRTRRASCSPCLGGERRIPA